VQILNAVITALGATLAIVLAVVCLMYAVHLDAEPQLRSQMPWLLTLTGLFAGFGMAGAAAFVAHRRGWPARWVLQGLPLLSLASIVVFFARLRG
jgi:uncharacterized YccA/Bax inhibitor family protein